MNGEMIAAYIVADPQVFQKSRRIKISDHKVEAIFFSCHWLLFIVVDRFDDQDLF